MRLLEPRRHLLAERPQNMRGRAAIGLVLRKGRLGRDGFGLSVRIDPTIVFTAREMREAHPDPAVARTEVTLVEGGELADAGEAVGRQSALHRAADAPQPTDWLVGEKGLGLGTADHRKPARLVEIGGELGEE